MNFLQKVRKISSVTRTFKEHIPLSSLYNTTLTLVNVAKLFPRMILFFYETTARQTHYHVL